MSIMTKTKKTILTALAVAAIFVAGARVQTAQAQNSASVTDSKQKEKNLAAGEVEAKRLLLLMDRDQSGKVSKQEFMSFMEEEFQRLDVNKDGELDVQELTRSRLTPHGGRER
jgi:hypothetical protein